MGFYARLRDIRKDDSEMQNCIEAVVTRLDQNQTSESQPGMLLGKIQSGKTRGFLGVIARAFDRDYDIALVFTKGTRTLATQTVHRISSDFSTFIEEEEVAVFDIMHMPERLTRGERRRKLIIVIKKESNNLKRVNQLFMNSEYPELKEKRVLLIDDEADMASIRFVKKKDKKEVEQGAIAQQMDALRRLVQKLSFLQVTATPYALYLQPEAYPISPENPFLFLPKRPAFTVLLPTHGGYVGGDDYFGTFEASDPRHYLFVEVPLAEQAALRSSDGRTIRADRIWTSANVEYLRRGVITFLVAVVIRRWQQRQLEQRQRKYAMIIHNDTQRAAHTWQWENVERLRKAFELAAEQDEAPLKAAFNGAFDDLNASISAHGGVVPSKEEAYQFVKNLILDGELNVQRVNSDVEVVPLLDPETAELKLRTQANIFIGGSLLDRGITIPAMIAFYYGRNPKRMQADTVLQHSRMYGNRDRADLAVTRFYTSLAVHERLDQINRLEIALRQAFDKGGDEAGVVFLQNDASLGIVPCAPNKIAMSNVVTVLPAHFYLPTGFDTVPGNSSAAALSSLDIELQHDGKADQESEFIKVPLPRALKLLSLAKKAIALPEASGFYWEAMEGLLRYYCKVSDVAEVEMIVQRGRGLSKDASGDKSGQSIVGGQQIRNLLASVGRRQPALVMLRQDGTGKGWKANMPFWWPVLAAPTDGTPCVFSAL